MLNWIWILTFRITISLIQYTKDPDGHTVELTTIKVTSKSFK